MFLLIGLVLLCLFAETWERDTLMGRFTGVIQGRVTQSPRSIQGLNIDCDYPVTVAQVKIGSMQNAE